MSTSILNNRNDLGVSLTRFWGGTERKRCYQITTDPTATDPTPTRYVQVTEAQMKALVEAYQKNI